MVHALRTITAKQQVGAGNVDLTPPAGKLWKVLNYYAYMVADAVASNRYIRTELFKGKVELQMFPTQSAATTATLTKRKFGQLNYAAGLNIGAIGDETIFALPDRFIDHNHQLRTNINGVKSGDKLDVTIEVLEIDAEDYLSGNH